MSGAPQLTVINNNLDAMVDTERALLGCALVGDDEVRQMAGWLKPELFHDQTLGRVWRRFIGGESAMDVGIELGLRLEFYALLGECMRYYDAPALARKIARAHYVDSISPLTAKLAKAVSQGDYDAVVSLNREISKLTPASEHKVRNSYDVGGAFLEMLDEPDRTLTTWITPLDDAIGGLERQTLSVLAATTSMGKSSLAFQIAQQVAFSEELGRKVLFISLEMSEANLWARVACTGTGTTWLDIKRRRATEAQLTAIRERSFMLMNATTERLMIHDKMTTLQILWELTATERPDLVIVDHLRLLGDQDDNEVKRLGALTWGLKQMAKELDCHVMTLAQLNRKASARAGADKRPTLTDLRDSGQIEENADLVLMMYRDGYYKPGSETTQSLTEVWIRKNRDGIRDVKVNLNYDLRKQWFEWA